MSGKKIALAICGETFPQVRESCGDFAEWFSVKLTDSRAELVVWNAHAREKPPTTEGLIGCIVSGSPAMVTDRAVWSEELAQWLVQRVHDEMPVLGICYGHQLLADVLGGQVDYQPDGREIGSLLIQQTKAAADDALFSQLPDSFYAHLTHGQSVIELPEQAVCLASNQRVPIQAFRYGTSCWGVQFHPEFSTQIMSMYLDVYHDQIPAEMRVQLHTHIHQCHEACSLLEHFAVFCLNKE